MAITVNENIIKALLKRQPPEGHWSDPNLQQAFTWGQGGQRRTAGQIERDRKVAEALAKGGADYSPIQHPTQGMARVMQALAGVVKERRATEAERTNATASAANIQKMLAAYFPQPGPQSAPPVAPQTAPSPVTPQQPVAPVTPPISDMPPIVPAIPGYDGAVPPVNPSFDAPPATPVLPQQTNMPPVLPQMAQAPQAQAHPVPQNASINLPPLSPDPKSGRLPSPSARDIMGFLTNEGLSPVQAAALTGNLYQESKFNPYAANMSVLPRTGQPENSHGLMQWRLDRLDGPNGLKAFAAKAGTDWRDWRTQLRFAIHELKTRENRTGGAGFLQAQDINTANNFLRRSIRYGDQSLAARAQFANRFLNEYGNVAPNATAPARPPAMSFNDFLKGGSGVPLQPIAPNFAENLPGNQQPQTAQTPQAPLFLGDSHAAALAQFGNGKSQGVNGATIAQSVQQLESAPAGSTVFLSAGTNDAVGQVNEAQVRAQVARAAEIAQAKGINLTWAGPTGPRSEALDALLADATKAAGINYRSVRNTPMAMQPDGVHAQIGPQGYGAMWNALQQQPEMPAQPYKVASLDPAAAVAPQAAADTPPMPEAPPQQLAQADPMSVSNLGLRAAPQGFAQPPQVNPAIVKALVRNQAAATPQAEPPQQRALPPIIFQTLSNPAASPAEKSMALGLINKWVGEQGQQGEIKVLPNGDVVSIDKRTNRVVPIYSAPKSQWGVIGKDQFGREQYGFINPNARTVEPYAPPQTPQAPSVIPPVPAGVDPKIWNEQHSKRYTEGYLGPTDENVTKLRGEIRDLPSYKNMAVVAPAYNRMVKSAANDNRAADLSLVYTFMKMLDPNSVVRESEVSMAQNVPTLPEQYRATLQSFLTGKGRLEPAVREALVQEAKIAAQSYRQQWDRDVGLYRGIMKRRKINEEDVFSDFEPFEDFTPPPAANTDATLNDIDAEIARRRLGR